MKSYFQYLSLLIICTSFSYGQQDVINEGSQSYFKLIPLSINDAPIWAQLMYGEEPNLYEVEKAYQSYYSNHVFEKNIHTQNYKYWLNATRDLVTADGLVSSKLEINNRSNINDFKKQRYSNVAGAEIWKNIGPNQTYKNNGTLDLRPTQANVYCIAVAPSNTNVLYCGSESGGLFKTIDKGEHWKLIAKDEIITNAADIKVDPRDENTLLLAFGNDIYKSIDGGNAWQKVYDGNGKIEHFFYSRKDNNTIFATSDNGLLRSTNNGINWTKTMVIKCWDIVGHPTDSDIIYLSIHNASKKRAEIYKSIDGGETWLPKTTNWYVPTDIQNARDIGCKIAVSKADPNRIYACLIGESKENDNGWIGIYYSLDGGDNWVNADGNDGGPYASGSDVSTNWFVAGYSSGYHQGWYNFDLAASSIDPDILWLGTIWFCESDNRGKNIEYIRGTRQLEMHADIQDIDVVGRDIWIVSDGGINYSNDECQTVEIRNNGISASNYWGFSQGWNEDTWTGGRYHNGDAVYHENYGIANTLFMGGAEASTGYINPMDNRKSYYSDIKSIITPDSLNIAAKSFSKLGLYPNESYSTLNSSEIEHDPRYANIMYLGRDNVFYKSLDAGQTYGGLFEFPMNNRLLEFEISRKDPNVIYMIAKNNGCKLYRSVDGGQSFNLTTSIPTNNRSTYDLSLDPDNENNLWVILHNGNNGKKVFNTKDGGITWQNRTTSVLDNHRIFDVVYQGGTDDLIYIVTSTALFYWDNKLGDWTLYSDGLPFLIRPLKMIPFYRDKKLRLSTSRGIWEAPLIEQSQPLAQPITLTSEVNCSRKKVHFEDYSIVDHTNTTWLWDFPGASDISSLNTRNPWVSYDNIGSYDVTLTVTDDNGISNSKTVKNMIVVDDDFCGIDKDPQMALSCSGSNVYAENNTIKIDSVDHFTFTAWIKPDSIQSDYTGIFSMGTLNSQKSVLNFRGGNNTLGFHWNSDHWRWNSGLVVPRDEWSYVAMTVTPTEVILYLNDEMAKRSISGLPIHIRKILLGSYYGWSSRNYNGLIEEACFWSRTLSQDEIRLARHLTKQDVTDPYMLAYYQFNNEDAGIIYDKVGINDLLKNGTQLVHSTAPIGYGKSQKMIIDQSGNYIFDVVDMSIDFDEMGVLPEDELIVSKIEIGTGLRHFLKDNTLNPEYWIINNYSKNKTLDNVTKLNFLNIEGLNKYSDPISLGLSQRKENSGEVSEWEFVTVASALNNTEKSVSFPGIGISELGQYFIREEFTVSTTLKKRDHDKKSIVYPNPIIIGEWLRFKNLEEEILFTLYDEMGHEMIKKRINKNSSIKLPNELNGMYYYQGISPKQMFKGKLIVH